MDDHDPSFLIARATGRAVGTPTVQNPRDGTGSLDAALEHDAGVDLFWPAGVAQFWPAVKRARENAGFTGADLLKYREQRGLTLGLAARELGVEKALIAAAEAAPTEALWGPMLVQVRKRLAQERAVDALLPPEAPRAEPTGATLLEWRKREGLNQQAAAERLGVSQGYVAKAEGALGKVLGPTLRAAFDGAG